MKFIKASNWSKKYGRKPFKSLTKGTCSYYQWCAKLGRREFLLRSRIKDTVFQINNMENLNWRVFKCTILKGKNVSPEMLLKFKKLVETKGSVKYGFKYKHLTPKALYIKMKGV